MSCKRPLCIASIVALTSFAGGDGVAGDSAVETGSRVLRSRQFDGQVAGGLMLAAPYGRSAQGLYDATHVGGGSACSPYELVAYKGGAAGCGGILSVEPSSKDNVVYFFRNGAHGRDSAPAAEVVLDGSNRNSAFVQVTLRSVETTTVYALNSGSGDVADPGPLIVGNDASFYGISGSDDAFGYASVVRMSITGVETVIYSFGVASLR